MELNQTSNLEIVPTKKHGWRKIIFFSLIVFAGFIPSAFFIISFFKSPPGSGAIGAAVMLLAANYFAFTWVLVCFVWTFIRNGWLQGWKYILLPTLVLLILLVNYFYTKIQFSNYGKIGYQIEHQQTYLNAFRKERDRQLKANPSQSVCCNYAPNIPFERCLTMEGGWAVGLYEADCETLSKTYQEAERGDKEVRRIALQEHILQYPKGNFLYQATKVIFYGIVFD